MSQLTQFAYPYDPTGVNPANKIVGERHVVSVAGSDYRLIIPKIGPYFKDSLKIKHVQTGDFLVSGLDFAYSYYFEAASNTEPYPSIFGGISILTSAYDGATLELTEYQSLGGEFVLAEESIATLLANVLIDPRNARWDDVTYKPGYWTPDSHLTHLEETVGYGELVQAVRDLTQVYTIQTQNLTQLMMEHMQSESDPHNVAGRLLARVQTLEDNVYAALDDINLIAGNLITLDGPAQVFQGESYEWVITNYDSFSSYAVSGEFPGARIENKRLKIDVPQNMPDGNRQLVVTRSGKDRPLILNVNGRTSVRPVILFAYNNQINVPNNPTLTVSDYATIPANQGTFAEIQWQFAMDSGFQNLVVNVTHLTLGQTLQDPLPIGTTLYVRCRYRGTEVSWSQWSSTIRITTANIEASTITIVGTTYGEDGENRPRYTHEFLADLGPYTGPGTHAATQWQIHGPDGKLFDSVYGTASSRLRSLKPYDVGIRFDSDTVITIQARQCNDAGVWGPYRGHVVSLATREMVDEVGSELRLDITNYAGVNVDWTNPGQGVDFYIWTDTDWPSGTEGGRWTSFNEVRNATPPNYTYPSGSVHYATYDNGELLLDGEWRETPVTKQTIIES